MQDKIFKILEENHKLVQESAGKPEFITSLKYFIEYIDKTPETSSLIKSLEKERAKDYENFYFLKQKTLNELSISKRKLLSIIKENKLLKHKHLSERIQNLKDYEKGIYEVTGEYYEILNNTLIDICEIIYLFIDPLLVGKFYFKHEHAKYIHVEVSNSITLLQAEKKSILLSQKNKNWFYWYSLKYVPIVCKYNNELPTFKEIFSTKELKQHEELADFPIDLFIIQDNIMNNTNNIQADIERLNLYTKRLFLYIIENISIPKKFDEPEKNRLIFYPEDGITTWGITNQYNFNSGTKAYVLLDFLYLNRNFPFTLEDFIEKCNPHINIEKNNFKGYEDIRQTIKNIKKCLGVTKGQPFPIRLTTKKINFKQT